MTAHQDVGESFRDFCKRLHPIMQGALQREPQQNEYLDLAISRANPRTMDRILMCRHEFQNKRELQNLLDRWEAEQWHMLHLPDPYSKAQKAYVTQMGPSKKEDQKTPAPVPA